MIRLLARHWYALAIGVLAVAILAAGAFVVAVVVPQLEHVDSARTAVGGSAAASSGPWPSQSIPPDVMTWLAMPADADCSACHVTDAGTIGVRPVPPMGHPLEGWTECTACHARDRLVATAPGHTGIHATDCLTCHQPGQLPAPLSRPHRETQNTACLDCHGKTEPLPNTMAHRTQTVCWLCHRLPTEQPPVVPHQIAAGETDCLTCHVAARQGALPADHKSRTVAECLLCHGPPSMTTPQASAAPAATAPPPAEPPPAVAPQGDIPLRYRLLPRGG
jgi:hypothetical protein